jgi:hypothetical protein
MRYSLYGIRKIIMRQGLKKDVTFLRRIADVIVQDRCTAEDEAGLVAIDDAEHQKYDRHGD